MNRSLRVLALNAFHGGSHRAFLEDWSSGSRHDWTLLALPARKWKWRMRHAAITFAEQSAEWVADGKTFDVLFCTDMLNLAEFLGVCAPGIHKLPRVVYFHENQLTYPQQAPSDRDLHFAFSNFLTAFSASEVWFNSAFHRDEFLQGFEDWLPRLPDFQPFSALEAIREKSVVQSPGIRVRNEASSRTPSDPLTILWVSRWEHDKNPELFFQALKEFTKQGIPFRLNVLGESYSDVPSCFAEGRLQFQEQIASWGYLPQWEDYASALASSDVVVSTANHEFFGIAILEAVAAGCFPLVPRRLAYPEVLGEGHFLFHQDTTESIAERLGELATWKAEGRLNSEAQVLAQRVRKTHGWDRALPRLDEALGRCT